MPRSYEKLYDFKRAYACQKIFLYFFSFCLHSFQQHNGESCCSGYVSVCCSNQLYTRQNSVNIVNYVPERGHGCVEKLRTFGTTVVIQHY